MTPRRVARSKRILFEQYVACRCRRKTRKSSMGVGLTLTRGWDSAILGPMTQRKPVRPSEGLANVRYEIRGKLARRALALERLGYDIVSLNIGNPYAFGFRTPETMRLAMIENLRNSEGYVHQKGIFPAREAVVMQQQERGVRGVTAEEVFIGNGVSELIDLSLRALLNPGDEVLVPSPDYPLWTAAVNLNAGRAVHYPCLAARSFIPDPQDIEALVTKRTRAIVIVNPNNPTGAVYPRETLSAIAQLAEKHRLVVLSDEVYDHIVYDDAEFVPMATLVHNTLCCTMSGLSKVYRACGYRVGWAAFSGDVESAGEYLSGLELLSSLRLCSNVPGQWAVQTALGGHQSILELTRPGGRLYESRQAILDGVGRSKFLKLSRPMGALYAFVEVRSDLLPDFDDQAFALELLENKHVLVAPGVSFNVPYRNCFRITNLPEPQVLATVFSRIEEVLEGQAAARPELQVVGSKPKVQQH
jgi:alanine-synthesizing transaminase